MYLVFFCILIFLNKNNINIDSIRKKTINNFKMSMLKTERVENKFLNFKFFLKDDENAKNNVNMSKL